MQQDQHLPTGELKRLGSLGGYIDWRSISPRDIQQLAYDMFDAARAPNDAVENYFRAFNRYIYSLP